VNGDGFISLEEMVGYLTPVFRIMMFLESEMFLWVDSSPETIAHATAVQCFSDADTNGDGKLRCVSLLLAVSLLESVCGAQSSRVCHLCGRTVCSLEEFRSWYSASRGAGSGVAAGAGAGGAAAHASSFDSLEAVRSALQLNKLSVTEIARRFTPVTGEDGQIARADFDAVFHDIVSDVCEEMPPDELVSQLFDLFDVDGSGTVDFAELTSGLAILCGGSADERIRAAFDLYGECRCPLGVSGAVF
jgi:Ca2+-binding EF-hand superfamily protein